MSHYPKVSIIILNYNGRDVLAKCLSSLFKHTDYRNYKVVLVDNASTDNSLKAVSGKFKMAIIRNDKNIGFVKANNIGIKYTMKHDRPAYVVLLNNDTEIIENDWLTKMVNCAENDKNIGVVGCRLVFPDGESQWAASKKTFNVPDLILQTLTSGMNEGTGDKNTGFVGYANSVSGACMMIRTGLMEKIGLLDEKMSPFFGEDVEFCYRNWARGYSVFYLGNVRVVHYQSYTFNKYNVDMHRKKFYWSLVNGIKICKIYFGLQRTLLYGSFIFTFAIFFERNDKTKKLSLSNLKPRDNLFYSFCIWIKALKELSVV